MSEKVQPWSEYEDRIIRLLREEKKIQKWTAIAQIMKEQYNIPFRSSKQCRERYNNHLDPNVSNSQWTKQEEQLLFELHNEFGNKWAIIADKLKGRNDNCVKNYFYSRLRKAIRKVNQLLQQKFKKHFPIKQFKTIDLYKIIEASDEKYKQVKTQYSESSKLGLDLKNRLYWFAEDDEANDTLEEQIKSKQLISDMVNFIRNYKRKSKKSRRYSPMGAESVYRKLIKKVSENEVKGETMPAQNGSELASQLEADPQKDEKQCKIEEECEVERALIAQNQQLVVTVKTEEELQKCQVKRQAANRTSECSSTLKSGVQCITPHQLSRDLKDLLQKENKPDSVSKSGTRKFRSFSRDFKSFSDSEEQEQKPEPEEIKGEKLNQFAENILRTFKSYYSFKSFKSNSCVDEHLFQ